MFSHYFDEIPPASAALFHGAATAVEPLNRLESFFAGVKHWDNQATVKGDIYLEGPIMIGKGTVIEHGAVIIGPTIIGENCEIRAGAYIRGFVVTGDNCVIGHSTEVIRSILLNEVRIDHFNYVGDSILGNEVHFGAGAKVANVRFDKGSVKIGGETTDRKKFGVILGDRSQIGVNVTIGPGVVFAKDTWYVASGLLKSGMYDRHNLPLK